MMTTIKKATTLFVIALVTSVFGQAKRFTKEETEARLMNMTSCPLQHRAESGTSYAIVNYSNKHVVKFQLACVIEEEGKLRAVTELPTEKTDLSARTKDTFAYQGKLLNGDASCEEGRLVFLKVWFSDESSWQLSDERYVISPRIEQALGADSQ